MPGLIAASSSSQLWPLPLDCRYIDGDNWKILADFQFVSPSPDFPSVLVPAGFETDFASIPRFFWRYMHPTDRRIGKMAVIHDWWYRTPSCAVTRQQADNGLRAGMIALGANRVDREAVYLAVHGFGGGSFKPRRVA